MAAREQEVLHHEMAPKPEWSDPPAARPPRAEESGDWLLIQTNFVTGVEKAAGNVFPVVTFRINAHFKTKTER